MIIQLLCDLLVQKKMVKLENIKDLKIISLEKIIGKASSKKEKKQLKEIFKRFNENELSESYRIQNKLERIILDYFREEIEQKSFTFNGKYAGFDSPDLIPRAEPDVEYVSQTFLDYLAGNNSPTAQVLGAYDPLMNKIYILNTLTGREHDKVLYHERTHWRHPNAPEEDVRRMTAMAGYSY